MHAPLPTQSRLSLSVDGSIEGYASLFGEIDQARDMVMPGAFTRTLQQRGLRKIPMLFQHDPAEPVGVWLELTEDFRGLRARGRLIPDVARGRELLALLRAGAVDGLSIGYRTVRGQIDPKSRVRRLYQVDLWEISIVTFPLLNGARVNAVKQTPQARLRAAAERQWRNLQGPGPQPSGSAADAPAPPARRGRAAVTLASRAGRKLALAGVARCGL
ncbi:MULTISPECIES: HK97 family phage prohead protease [Rhodopseudomonas]|uniref:Peptidase U35 n=1 Tax=Rhodopseudomonas palustris TaxID=1076 RepID=A0A0D7ECD4_RHOPL|nr:MULTISPECIES: HK97 family phage prohead protease [Rhodopseudomonas]KIZ37217.1 peptidase U35 [Rhodopseudomonas palustris]MDF3811086.1 HK97 family phage prohead protease [Rhodopseudomonas sp. BAL398]WOK19978.1 HK97 family phage prohead protease [Rhodopseudomonas sp. BAL398]